MDLSEELFQPSGEDSRHFWELARADFLLFLLKKYLAPDKAGMLLDVGCGDGYLLRRMCDTFPPRKFVAVVNALNPARIAGLDAFAPGRLQALRELPL